MEPAIESSARDAEEIASDHDEEYLLLPLHRDRAHRSRHVDTDDEAPVLSDYMRAILPQGVQNIIRTLHMWLQGPRPPQRQHITPLRLMPLWLQDKLAIKRQALFVAAILLAWAIVFFTVVWQWSLLPDLPGYGRPRRIRCMQQAW